MNSIKYQTKVFCFTFAVFAIAIYAVLLPTGSSASGSFSYPILKAGQDYVNTEIRRSNKYAVWEQMTVIHTGSVNRGDSWTGGEGARICAKATNNSTGNLAGQPVFCSSSSSGISEGQAETSTF